MKAVFNLAHMVYLNGERVLLLAISSCELKMARDDSNGHSSIYEHGELLLHRINLTFTSVAPDVTFQVRKFHHYPTGYKVT